MGSSSIKVDRDGVYLLSFNISYNQTDEIPRNFTFCIQVNGVTVNNLCTTSFQTNTIAISTNSISGITNLAGGDVVTAVVSQDTAVAVKISVLFNDLYVVKISN